MQLGAGITISPHIEVMLMFYVLFIGPEGVD
jgi:hypothetical protein